jgi:hypothetical protein
MTPARGRALLIASIAAVSLLAGCIPGYVRVVLMNEPGTNANTPFYLLVRKVEQKDFTAQPYSAIAQLLDLPDASVLRTQLLYPGRKYHFYLKNPEKESLALYFLLTDPGGTWSLLLSRPLPWQVKASLRGNIVMREVAR